MGEVFAFLIPGNQTTQLMPSYARRTMCLTKQTEQNCAETSFWRSAMGSTFRRLDIDWVKLGMHYPLT